MKLFAVVMVCALVGACEKAGDHAVTDDTALLKDVPGGNTLVLGGNFMKLQGFMDSTLGKLTESMMSATGAGGAGYKAWAACFTDRPNIRMAGGLKIAGGIEMRFAFRGMTIADVNGCAGKAGYKATVDPDGKYISVDVPGVAGQTMAAGYLALPDGAVLFDQEMQLGLAPTVVPSTRAKIEAIAGTLATDNAGSDKHLVELAAKADRTKTLWFAGTGANTPLASKVGDIYGAIDMRDGGLSLDATITFTDGSFATFFADRITKAKQAGAYLAPAMKSVVDAIKVERTDGTVHIAAGLTAQQISDLMALKGVK